MRVVVHDYFGHAFPAQLARALAGRGHDVLHLHCSSFVAGKGRLERTDADPSRLEFVAVDLGEPFAKYEVMRRIGHEWKTARALSSRLRHFCPEAVLSTAPLIVQAELLRTSHALGAAFVFWQQDVISIAAGRVIGRRSRLAGAAAKAVVSQLERHALRRSEAVAVISEDFRPQLRRWGVDESRVVTIENWAPLDELPALPRGNAWSHEHGLDGRAVFLYSGTLGYKHDPALLLELAKWAAKREAVVVVVSEGPGADWLAHRAGSEAALRLLPYQPYDRLPEVLASADVLVAVLEPAAGAFSVPSKILAYLCAARPLLVSMPRDNLAARLVERSGGGVIVPPTDRKGLLDAAQRLLADEGLRSKHARRARAYAERTFDIDAIAGRFEEVFERATCFKR